MSSQNALIFLGGIADSGKSALASDLSLGMKGLHSVKISEFFRKILVPTETEAPLNAAVVYTDWKSREKEAVAEIVRYIPDIRGKKSPRAFMINGHFATYSPGGFMMGLDPSSILRICVACNLLEEKCAVKAAVVLVDIGLGDVLALREETWNARAHVKRCVNRLRRRPSLSTC